MKTTLDIHSKICAGNRRNSAPAPVETKTISDIAQELKLKYTDNELTELFILIKK